MAARGQKKKLALDTNILFDLAEDRDFAHTFRELYQERGYQLCIPPTVIQELAYWAFEEAGSKSILARKALENVLDWELTPYDLKAVGHGITEAFARTLFRKRLLPETELNDGLILAETSLAFIPALVTSDHHLLDIDSVELKIAFEEQDLEVVQVCHPKSLVKAMGGK